MKIHFLKSDYNAAIFLLIIILFFFYRFFYEKDVKENKYSTIAFTTKFYQPKRQGVVMKFKYCYKEKIYTGTKSIHSNPRDYLFKIYDLEISKNNPEHYIIKLDKESASRFSIIDSCLFKNADKELKNLISVSIGYKINK